MICGAAPTAATDTGATCTLETTADAVRPGLVPEGRRSLWQLGQVEVYDGGTDEDAAVPDEDENATPAVEEKKPAPPQQDEQMEKAIQLIKTRTS